MRLVIFAIILALPAALLNGCIATAPTKPESSYPSRLEDFGQYDRFPAAVAGYRRGEATAYAPGLVDYSVAYDRYDAQLQSAVTLYFYPRLRGNQFEAEQSEITRAHRGAIVRSNREITLQARGGVVYNATLTTFEFDDMFAGRQQRVSSQLLLVLLPVRTFKVRSTAPIAQAEAAEGAMLKVVEGVEWVSNAGS